MNIRYLGTASVLIEYAGLRILTDPVFDPMGTQYDFGTWYTPRSWFSSEKQYATPVKPEDVGPVDVVLLSHDHHADNLDHAGREFLRTATAAKVYTTTAGAARLTAAPRGSGKDPGDGLGLGDRAVGVGWAQRVRIVVGERSFFLTATPARHGPLGTPQIHEVNGWLLEPETAGSEPVLWISGDTVLFGTLQKTLEDWRTAGRKVDVALLHCGGVQFPKLPLLGRSLFTFNAAQVVDVVKLVTPRLIVPVHRSGWSHFREPEAELRRTLASASPQTTSRFLDLNETLTVS